MARIALDAMGGDFAPGSTVAGALRALQELDASHSVQLVGLPDVIRAELERSFRADFTGHRDLRDRIQIVEARDPIGMGDKPTLAVKRPDNPMTVGLALQKRGESDAFVSAGNTGAQMVISVHVLGLHPEISRPAIATVLPGKRVPVILLDSGAMVDCSADELLQFARVGAVYAECVHARRNPTIGLLSIGEEPGKGNKVVKEAHRLFEAAGLNFLGNVEGRDLPRGECARGPIDVVVCDGFVGNVVLKFYEAVLPMIGEMLEEYAGVPTEMLTSRLGPLNVEEYGGAPLLGVQGVSIICHGNSSPRAIQRALQVAVRAVESRMDQHIGERLSGTQTAGGGVLQ